MTLDRAALRRGFVLHMKEAAKNPNPREPAPTSALIHDLNGRAYGNTEWIATGCATEKRGTVEPAVKEVIDDIVAEFVLSGVLRLEIQRGNLGYWLTAYGMRCVNSADAEIDVALLSDPDGVADAFRKDFGSVPGADLLARYIGQASRCARQGMELAGATMIGCAYELALVQLATAVLKRWPAATNTALTGRVKDAARKHDAGDYAPAGLLADVVSLTLDANRGVVPDHEVWLKSCFAPTFHVVREMRNDAGHPSGNPVDLDVLRTYIVNFLPSYRRVRAIIDAL